MVYFVSVPDSVHQLLYEETHKKVIEYYNKMQPYYEILWALNDSLAMHYGFWDDTAKNAYQAQINENRYISECLQLDASDIVLDAGCGVCGTALWMASNYRCKVKGITICVSQVKRGLKYIKKRKLEHLVSIELNDFCNTGYTNESFTKIFGIESICCANSKEEFISEAYRLLKPNGRLVIADGIRKMDDMPPDLKKIYDIFCEGWALPGLASLEELKQGFSKAGFVDINVEILTAKVLPSAQRIWIINIPFYIPVTILNIFHIAPVLYKDTITGLNQKKIFEKGIGEYIVISGRKP
jgi:cyclopropane fatty-acyl-phospholipid synthase-like methyltransferase